MDWLGENLKLMSPRGAEAMTGLFDLDRRQRGCFLARHLRYSRRGCKRKSKDGKLLAQVRLQRAIPRNVIHIRFQFSVRLKPVERVNGKQS